MSYRFRCQLEKYSDVFSVKNRRVTKDGQDQAQTQTRSIFFDKWSLGSRNNNNCFTGSKKKRKKEKDDPVDFLTVRGSDM